MSDDSDIPLEGEHIERAMGLVLPVDDWFVDFVTEVFAVMLHRYGTDWERKWSGQCIDLVIRQWARELSDLTPDQLKRGVLVSRDAKYPPTCPEFRAFCVGNDNAPIAHEVAYSEAVRNVARRRRGENPTWSHPAIFWAAHTLGTFELMNSNWHQVKARWVPLLNSELAKGRWPPIPEPNTDRYALVAPGKTRVSADVAHARMADILANLTKKLKT